MIEVAGGILLAGAILYAGALVVGFIWGANLAFIDWLGQLPTIVWKVTPMVLAVLVGYWLGS